MSTRQSRTRIKSTVACPPLGTTEEDHDPTVPAHTRPHGRRLRVQLLHVRGDRTLAGRMLKEEDYDYAVPARAGPHCDRLRV
ncbi:jg3287 [Pararge aegeria aegeria]|uniref:Jg3287 protein n=1 Tax=Pararge aegeria aegeria TaxID=348720 RepID=A0A8S4RUX4_9NEOP|nr:jg3287 [Pararge aegeria aegeria]